MSFEYCEYIILKEIFEKGSIASSILAKRIKLKTDISNSSIRNKVHKLRKMGLIDIIPNAKPMIIVVKNAVLIEQTLTQVGVRLGFERRERL